MDPLGRRVEEAHITVGLYELIRCMRIMAGRRIRARILDRHHLARTTLDNYHGIIYTTGLSRPKRST